MLDLEKGRDFKGWAAKAHMNPVETRSVHSQSITFYCNKPLACRRSKVQQEEVGGGQGAVLLHTLIVLQAQFHSNTSVCVVIS